jgi:hypothetical protein
MRVVIFVLVISVFFFSCKKQREKNIQVSKDYALYQNDLSSILPLFIHITSTKTYFNSVLKNQADTLNCCASANLVSGDTALISNGPIVFELDFDNCMDKDGFVKDGMILCTVYNYSSVAGGNIRMSFDEFKIGNSTLKGSVAITRIGVNEYTVSTSNFSISVDGDKISYDAFLNYSIDLGAVFEKLNDNVLVVSDENVFVNRNGVSYDVLNKQITRYMSCSYFSIGKVEIVNDKNTTQVLDFGTGGCENGANVTLDDDLFSINIK